MMAFNNNTICRNKEVIIGGRLSRIIYHTVHQYQL